MPEVSDRSVQCDTYVQNVPNKNAHFLSLQKPAVIDRSAQYTLDLQNVEPTLKSSAFSLPEKPDFGSSKLSVVDAGLDYSKLKVDLALLKHRAKKASEVTKNVEVDLIKISGSLYEESFAI